MTGLITGRADSPYDHAFAEYWRAGSASAADRLRVAGPMTANWQAIRPVGAP